MSVVQFPTEPLCRTLEGRYNDLLTRMRTKGMTDEQIIEMLIDVVKEMGGVEKDGVWYVGCSPDAVQGDPHG